MISTTGSIVNTQCTSLLVFDYSANYKISDETDVKVYYITALGVEILLTNGPDYSVTLITETGFNVELVASYDTGSLSIRRETPQVQETEFMPGGDFPASAFEDTLDRLVMMQQEMEEILSRAVTIAKADSGDMVLPAAASRINRFFAFDENGDATTHPGTVPADANIIASDVDVLDIASNFTATEVEAALAETSVAEQLNTTHRAVVSGNPHIVKASEVDVVDADGNYTATEVEAILKEIAETVIPPSGVILPYGGSSSPLGYLLCDGAAISRTTYSSLFAVIDTTFGVGDGSTTFNVPDTKGAFLRGAGTSTKFTQNHTTTLGTYEDDAIQGHEHQGHRGDGNDYHQYPMWGGILQPTSLYDKTVGIISNGIDGDPRATNETRPNNLGVNYIIKI